jgi:hypothetical protein
MSERIHALAQLLLGKASLEECSIEELQHLTKRYPYFAPAQFLLLQKLKAIASPDYESQQRKAVLYFHDPLQFDYFVSSDKFYFDESSFAGFKSAEETAHADDLHPTTTILAGGEALLQQDVVEQNEAEKSVAVPQIVKQTENVTQVIPVAEAAEEPHQFFAEQPNIENIEIPVLSETQVPDESSSIPVEIEPADAQAEPTGEQPLVTEGKEEELMNETPQAPAENDETLLQELVSEENPVDEEPTVSHESSPTMDLPVASENSNNLPEQQLSKTSTEINETEETTHSGENAKTSATGDGAPLFEPYHTVDYFASQGIKISSDELPKDRLGKQLRSFTEWLKMMKRLPASEMAKATETAAEKTVETLANHSVEESAVVTEAMAEVWIKQGNSEKAIETYNKLSLLNPSKKAYFAAKIENLKGS